jgi:ABC-type nitrate/sulfonate/bicarbonate transport system substrate-binding protein
MARNLKAGNLDGYCSGEPWNTVAVQQQAGWVAATSAKIAPGHIEKVLLTTHEFATARADEHLRLIAALYEACAFCSLAENRERLVELLARPAYLNTTAAALRTSLCGPFDYGQGRVEEVSDFHVFAHDNANEPTAARAAWVLNQLRLCGARLQGAEADAETAAACFRADLFQAATRLHHTCTLQPA